MIRGWTGRRRWRAEKAEQEALDSWLCSSIPWLHERRGGLRVPAMKARIIQRSYRSHVARSRVDGLRMLAETLSRRMDAGGDSAPSTTTHVVHNHNFQWPSFVRPGRSRPRTPIMEKVSWDFLWDVYLSPTHDETVHEHAATILQSLFRGAQGRRRAHFRKVQRRLRQERLQGMKAQPHANLQARIQEAQISTEIGVDSIIDDFMNSLDEGFKITHVLRALLLGDCLSTLLKARMRKLPSLRKLMQPRWMVRILKSLATSEGTLSAQKLRAYARGTSIDLASDRWQCVTEEYSVGKTVHLLWQNGAIVPEQEMMERRKRRTMLKAILLPVMEDSLCNHEDTAGATQPVLVGTIQQSLHESLRKRMHRFFPADFFCLDPAEGTCSPEKLAEVCLRTEPKVNEKEDEEEEEEQGEGEGEGEDGEKRRRRKI